MNSDEVATTRVEERAYQRHRCKSSTKAYVQEDSNNSAHRKEATGASDYSRSTRRHRIETEENEAPSRLKSQRTGTRNRGRSSGETAARKGEMGTRRHHRKAQLLVVRGDDRRQGIPQK
ncbi:unnamed protein product [Nesidiocoris tenuis]|uniref:Uncharacterized protein n=1 Tax=Nesidiocoris tenuis TaxID=355587 RepID=A0A6H5HTU8_9HEMI|nr:unnamed protein product [Nesidiocoris tenuis]